MAGDDKDKNRKSKIGRIEVDRDLCIGAGTCVVFAGTTFELDSEGKAIVLENSKNPPTSRGNLLASGSRNTDEEIIEAAKSCPTLAIKVFDTDGNQIYPT